MEEAVERRFQRIESILAWVGKRQAAAEVRMDRAEVRMDRAEVRMDRAEARMDRAEARMNRTEARVDGTEARFEKRMRGFEKLAKIGFRELAELRRLHRDTDKKLNSFIEGTDDRFNALIDAQQRTEASLRALLNGLRRSGNGRGGGRS